MQALRYPKKSHRKAILIPQDSIDLAEFLGIEFGDGGINNPWQVIISLNSISDKNYADYVAKISKNLFGITARLTKRPKRNTLVVVLSSTSLVEFLVTKGAVRGNKIAQEIDMPEWIKNNEEYQKAFVRGLVDTDGCLYIHKHTVKGKNYKNIGFCFTSLSKKLIISVANTLKKFDIQPHITDKERRIYLYNQADISKYLEVFGSSNTRITAKYQEWSKQSERIK